VTRRERHLRIIANMGDQRTNNALRRMLCLDEQFSLFTDEAVEKLASILVDDLRFERRLNDRNRQLRAGAATGR